MAETRARDLAKSLGQAVKTDNIASDGSLAVLGVTAYDSSGLLPTSYDSNNAGSLGFAKDSDRLFIHTGQGWFNIAIVNTTPVFDGSGNTIVPNASYALATDATAYKNGTATVITIQARDSEGFPITYAATGDTAFNNMAYVDKDSAAGFIFTVEPKSRDSAGSDVMPAGTLTFTATDGINIASATSTFTLSFDTTISGSEGTTFLSKAIGTGGVNNSFADKSTTGNTHSITASGNVSQGTFSPYSPTGYSWYFPGYSANAGVQTDTNGPTLGTGDLTVEFWFKNDYEFNTTSNTDNGYGYQNLVSDSLYGNSTDNGGWALYQRQDEIRLAVNNNSKLQHHYLHFNSQPSEWNHVAWVRNSGTSRIYVNGYDGGVSVSDTVNYPDNKILIGANNTSGQFPRYEYKGWIHDLRIVVGTPVYTGNFTPPIGPLTTTGGEYSSTTNVNTAFNGSHTKYQACNLPYIHYGKGSTGNAVQTVTGEVETDAFNPYKVQAAYSSSTHGGSAYFDGSGDRLSTASTTDTNTTAGQAWTVEGWIYPTDFSGGKVIFDFRQPSSGGTGITAEFAATGYMYMDAGGYSYISNENFGIQLKQWYHMAFVHTGSVFKFFLNGNERKSTTHSAGANDNTSGAFHIGTRFNNSKDFAGYISDFRFVAGTAVYTSAFTPPTAPLTEITNTKLLLNMTDAKVIDEGGRQNLVLYGDAKSHNGQPRVSGLSGMLFDGNGDVTTFSPKKGYIMDANEDYTVEFYTYYNASPAKTNNINPVFYNAQGYASSLTYDEAYINTSSSNALTYVHDGDGGSDISLANSQSVTNTGSFIHVAVVKRDRRLQTFVNGNPGTNLSIAHGYTFGDTGEGFLIGAYHSSGGWINSYISEFRITRGQGRYPFLPKKETLTTTTSFQDGVTTTASNVKNLALTSSTITAQGADGGSGHQASSGATASTFGPRGGMVSASFDGTTNAQITHLNHASLGTGVFTVELWMFSDSTYSGAYQPLIGFVTNNSSYGSDSAYHLIYVNSSGQLTFWNTTDFVQSPTSTVAHSKWYHVAVTRESDNKIRLYLNGTFMAESSSTFTANMNDKTRILYGRHADKYFKGYLSNIRMTTQVLYTKNFTPPTTEIKG